MITGPQAILLGDVVTGTLTASYGGHGTAVLETWKTTTYDEWKLLAPLPPPDTVLDLDTHPLTVEGIPDLGGTGFFYNGPARLTAVRISPPPKDLHIFHRDRAEAAKNGEDQKEDSDPNERKPSKRRNDRRKSCMRYTRFREDSKNRGRSTVRK